MSSSRRRRLLVHISVILISLNALEYALVNLLLHFVVAEHERDLFRRAFSGTFFCVLVLITVVIIILGKVRRLYTYPYCSPTRRPVLIPCWLISPLPVHE